MSSIEILSNFLVSSMGILISFSALSLPFMFILFAIIDCVCYNSKYISLICSTYGSTCFLQMDVHAQPKDTQRRG